MLRELYIDGAWVPGSGMIDVVDPATEAVVLSVASGGAEEIDRAVTAARRALPGWSATPCAERAAILHRMAELIEGEIDSLARLEVLDNGKPFPEAKWDIEDTAGCFHFYADLAAGFEQECETEVPLGMPGFASVARKEPVGVVGAIIPWNFPMLMASWKVAPALAAGCTVVLKPSELTPLTALELARIADAAGVPPGVLNVVNGTGAEAGAALSAHPEVDKLAFTGSVPTGSILMAEAARNIRNVSLELGGKSPFVIFADSAVEDAVEWIMFGIFWNQGEVCSATSRVLIERPLYQAVVDRLVEEARRIPTGPGMEDGVKLGPLVSAGQYRKVIEGIARGQSEGATLLTGGGRPEGLDSGFFVAPTIFADVPKEAWIWREEVFGPVLCVAPFDSEDEAVAEANDSRYGLAAAVMSGDEGRAQRVARRLHAGIVWVNCSQPTFVEAPWGGVRQSGIGRELGRWGFENYLETKQVTTYTSNAPWGWYLGT